jgi:hypothetical protein
MIPVHLIPIIFSGVIPCQHTVTWRGAHLAQNQRKFYPSKKENFVLWNALIKSHTQL